VSTHLRPTAPVAPDALLPGDPKRAMELATTLLEKPLMSNLSRGLWGYHGHTPDGRELTVQSTGIGGPSGAVVLAELAGLGVRRAIRVGTCVALDPGLEPGDRIVTEAALAGDGVGSALAPGAPPLRPDAALTSALQAAAAGSRSGLVASTDLYYDRGSRRREEWRAAGAVAVELSAAALLAVGRRCGVAVACGLVVAESAAGERLSDEDLEASVMRLGTGAAAALAAGAQEPVPEGASPV
jgi:uridine phosphorylase